jgi:hypothetical protein
LTHRLHALHCTHCTALHVTTAVTCQKRPWDSHVLTQFLPGQWLDTYCPGIEKAGGFTITSPPSAALTKPTDGGEESASAGYVELAVRQSADNPAAQYLWRPVDQLLHSELRIRVGGSFVFPPPGVPPTTLRRVVFVAGGVGINPLISMAAHMVAERAAMARTEVRFLYSLKDDAVDDKGDRDSAKMLFVDRLAGLVGPQGLKGALKLYLTGGQRSAASETTGIVKVGGGAEIPFIKRRVDIGDIEDALGPDRRFAVVYVCGVPEMTDHFVSRLLGPAPDGLGLEQHRVLYEKWW